MLRQQRPWMVGRGRQAAHTRDHAIIETVVAVAVDTVAFRWPTHGDDDGPMWKVAAADITGYHYRWPPTPRAARRMLGDECGWLKFLANPCRTYRTAWKKAALGWWMLWEGVWKGKLGRNGTTSWANAPGWMLPWAIGLQRRSGLPI